MPRTVAVLGAGGKTGREVVAALVAAGDTARAVVRTPEKHAAAFAAPAYAAGPGRVEVVAGDVTDRASLDAALAGCDGGAIFAASGSGYWSANKVDRDGVANAAAAAAAVRAGPLVLVSSALVTPKNRFHPIRVILNNVRYGLMDAKFAGEESLRTSRHPYTVVRPGSLVDGPPKSALEARQGDAGAGRVSRAAVAAVCVAALRNPAACGVTLELLEAKGGAGGGAPPPLGEQLRGFFVGLTRDGKA
jgi:uncharacterized protein YbjT (DUF2867 family)